MRNTKKKGFTIVELVIVIAVIGILAAVLIPTFSNVIESANKTADLQEAQSTLKAYTAFMGSKGSTLNDGTIFEVKRNNSTRTYVFYKGELQEAVGIKDVTPDMAVQTVKISNEDKNCNKYFEGFDVDGDGVLDDAEKLSTAEKDIKFYYYSTDPVTFEDGSLKCKIYAGKIVEQVIANN